MYWPGVVHAETRRMEFEARLRLEAERAAAALHERPSATPQQPAQDRRLRRLIGRVAVSTP